MNAINIPQSAPRIYSSKYTDFKGVDMSTDPTQISEGRSPFAPNLISDSGGFPEKRPGWRMLHTLPAPIHGLYYGSLKHTEHILIHAADRLYHWDQSTAPVLLREGLSNTRGSAFCLMDKLWVLTGKEYLVYDGETLKDVSEDARIPLTTIGRTPDGKDGHVYEPANLLTPKRKNGFCGTDGAIDYQLDVDSIGSEAVTAEVNGTTKQETADFTVNRTIGKVTFKTAPGKPAVDGQDNVVISFSKKVEGYLERIAHCTIATLYGVGNNDRAFLTGNPDYPATDWWCWFKDPTFFPDSNYADIGPQSNKIVGYSKIGAYLAIHKEDNSQDSTVYLRSAKQLSEATDTAVEKVAFPTVQGVSGVGALAVGSFAYLMDEPLFLARTGIYALSSSNITAERTAQNRSYYVNAALVREPGLEKACAVQWNGYYLLCVNSHCYILDGKQPKSYQSQSGGVYVYECYYWENVPAVCFLEKDGALFFGTADGRICRFSTDIEGVSKYNDNGLPIAAYWSTKADDDGDFMLRKTMVKRGCGVMIKPYARSSAKILVRTDRDFGTLIKDTPMDIFDWEDLDFSRFTFSANDGPQVVPWNVKVKKYVTMQVVVKNDILNEGFGVFGIIKRYTKGNYVK